jgi:hypothetical protein
MDRSLKNFKRVFLLELKKYFYTQYIGKHILSTQVWEITNVMHQNSSLHEKFITITQYDKFNEVWNKRTETTSSRSQWKLHELKWTTYAFYKHGFFSLDLKYYNMIEDFKERTIQTQIFMFSKQTWEIWWKETYKKKM